MKNYTSSENQRIMGKFVEKEVLVNANVLISELGTESDFRDEITELFFTKINVSETLDNALYDLDEEETEELLEYYNLDGIEELKDINIHDIIEHLDADIVYYEPLEFWIVSEWKARQLRNQGEIVANFLDFNIWGRCSSGQAIIMDDVIGKICDELGLLK